MGVFNSFINAKTLKSMSNSYYYMMRQYFFVIYQIEIFKIIFCADLDEADN